MNGSHNRQQSPAVMTPSAARPVITAVIPLPPSPAQVCWLYDAVWVYSLPAVRAWSMMGAIWLQHAVYLPVLLSFVSVAIPVAISFTIPVAIPLMMPAAFVILLAVSRH